VFVILCHVHLFPQRSSSLSSDGSGYHEIYPTAFAFLIVLYSFYILKFCSICQLNGLVSFILIIAQLVYFQPMRFNRHQTINSHIPKNYVGTFFFLFSFYCSLCLIEVVRGSNLVRHMALTELRDDCFLKVTKHNSRFPEPEVFSYGSLSLVTVNYRDNAYNKNKVFFLFFCLQVLSRKQQTF
jgi:hypothetical protein